jgi:hypothetical protein
MKKNMSMIDRLIRMIVAVALVILITTGVVEGGLAIVLGAVAVILAATAALGVCPLYMLFKMSTLKQK